MAENNYTVSAHTIALITHRKQEMRSLLIRTGFAVAEDVCTFRGNVEHDFERWKQMRPFLFSFASNSQLAYL